MSSRGAARPGEQEPKEQEEHFYDCQETLEPPGRGVEEEEEDQQEGGSEDFHDKTDRRTDRRDTTERVGGRGAQEEVQGDRLQEEVQGDRLREEVRGDRLREEVQGYRLREEVQGDRLREEVQGDRLREETRGDRLREEMQSHKLREETQSHRLQEEAQGHRLQEEAQGHKLQEEAQGHRLQEEAQGHRLQEEEQGDRLQEEEQGDRLQEDSDSEMKEEKSLEFDDDFGREVMELTEEEAESRRQQSLTLKEKGNNQFKAGEWLDAERSYTEALGLCPLCFSRERAVLFSNRAAARLHLDLKDEAISDCSRAVELNPDYVRAWLRRAELHEQMEKLDEALQDFKKVLDLDPTQTSARHACMRLPPLIQERNEKLKEEMMSKLKDLGNLVLRPFGLSTSNFQVNQDSDTGSYSINFVQNPNNNNR